MQFLKGMKVQNPNCTSSFLKFRFQYENLFSLEKKALHQNSQDYYKNMLPFNKTYPLMKQHLIKKIDRAPVAEGFEELLDYQVPFGRQSRAAIVVNVHEVLNPQLERKENNTLLPFHAMAWIVELFQAAALLIDDIIDASTYRRGKLAWHIGRERYAPYHAAILLSSCRFLLSDYHNDAPYFKAAANLLEKHIFKMLNLEAYEMYLPELIKNKKVSWDLYKSYTIDKSVYSTDLPFKLAVYSANNEEVHFDENVEKILEDLGYEMQSLNDTLEFFTKFDIGKEQFEDIKTGKLNWILAYIMENATDEDVDIVVKNYGINSDKCAEKVLRIYDKFNWKETFMKYDEELRNSINNRIKMVPNDKGLRDGLEITYEIISQGYRITNPNNYKSQ